MNLIDDEKNLNDCIKNDEQLLRLIWSKRDLKDGLVAPSSINKSDISKRGMSVDRENLVQKPVMETLAEYQKQQGLEKGGDLGIPLLARLETGAVREINYENECIFNVIPNPTKANPPLLENKAHALIVPLKKHNKSSRRKMNEFRTQLVKIMSKPIPFNEYFESN